MKATWFTVWLAVMFAYSLGAGMGASLANYQKTQATIERSRAMRFEGEVRRLRADLLQADARCR